MKAAVVCALVVVLAVAATTEAANCHTSAYSLPCSTVEAQKTQLWAKCAASAPGGVTPEGGFTPSGECCTIVQKTTDEAGWKAYSACEKSAANSALYGPLKAAPCEAMKKDEAC